MAWRSALSKNLQELRIALSQTSPGSQVTFTLARLIALKKVNFVLNSILRLSRIAGQSSGLEGVGICLHRKSVTCVMHLLRHRGLMALVL